VAGGVSAAVRGLADAAVGDACVFGRAGVSTCFAAAAGSAAMRRLRLTSFGLAVGSGGAISITSIASGLLSASWARRIASKSSTR
jgi:hypothetical protein